MLQPLKLGNLSFPVNLIQGPLAGISCAPFRRLTWRYSRPAFSCTEMLSVKNLIRMPAEKQRRFISKDKHEGPVCFQLAGDNPVTLAHAAKQVTDLGADLIDLNCGCPVRKIRSQGAGSSLLTNPQKLYHLIHALKQNTHVPVSIKIRVEGGSNETFHQEIAHAVQDAGADFLIVHGRHWTERYDTPCHYDHIHFFVDAMKIPIIGNGDISCIESLQKMFATNCAGVMISRAGVGQPWLIGKLIAELSQEKFTPPTTTEIGTIFLEHVTELANLLQNETMAIMQARKFAKYYARGLSQQLEFCNAMNHCERLETFIQLCNHYFSN